MKKTIAFVLSMILLIISAGCSDAQNNDKKSDDNQSSTENTIAVDDTVYSGVVFTALKTFDEITGATLNETDESKTSVTVFKYVFFENALQTITDYKNYLLEYGFKMTSDINDENNTFEFDGKELSLTSENGNSGSTISITIPCDEKTNSQRKEKLFNELDTAFNNKEYKKVLQIAEMFTSDEQKNYNNIKNYMQYSFGVILFNNGIYGDALKFFEYSKDKFNADDYITQIHEKVDKFNGIYKTGTNVVYYMIIKDGRVSFQFGPSFGTPGQYEIGAPVTYSYSLWVHNDVNGKDIFDIVDTNSFDLDYIRSIEYSVTTLDNGDYSVLKWKADIMEEVFGKTEVYEGVYTKISDTPAESIIN